MSEKTLAQQIRNQDVYFRQASPVRVKLPTPGQVRVEVKPGAILKGMWWANYTKGPINPRGSNGAWPLLQIRVEDIPEGTVIRPEHDIDDTSYFLAEEARRGNVAAMLSHQVFVEGKKQAAFEALEDRKQDPDLVNPANLTTEQLMAMLAERGVDLSPDNLEEDDNDESYSLEEEEEAPPKKTRRRDKKGTSKANKKASPKKSSKKGKELNLAEVKFD